MSGAIDIEPGEALYTIEATEYPAAAPEGAVEDLMRVLGFVADERHAQDIQHGGPSHDDTHTPAVWEDLIREHAYRLTDGDGPNQDYRARLIKIAALAVAAVQSWDRPPAAIRPTNETGGV